MTRTTYLNLRLLAIVAAVALAACLLVLVDAKLVWSAQANFTAPQNFGAGDSPESVVSADFNGDTKADLAVANIGADSNLIIDNVSVLLGNGNGTFGTAQNFNVGDGPLHLTSADFNGDTKADLAVANILSDNVSVLLGNGDGTFKAAQNFSVGDGPFSVSSADFNGDTKADLAVAYNGGLTITGGVSVLLGNGDGTFAAAQNFVAGSQPASVTSADFNGDTKVDLATANAGSDNVSVLLGKGDGTFGTAQNFGAADGTWFVTSADLNGDSKADLATANAPSIVSGASVPGNVSVLLGNGDGTFGAAQSFGAGFTPVYLASEDFDGDSKVDLAVADNGTSTNPGGVSTLSGNGDGTFGAAQNFAAGSRPAALVGALFNNDSEVDLAVANEISDNVSVLLNNTSTTPPQTSITSGPAGGSSTTSKSATFGFSSNEQGSTFQCQLIKDGAVVRVLAACTSPKSYSNLGPGNFRFEVKATDSDGNVDQTPASRNWTITSGDTTAPKVSAATPTGPGIGRGTNIAATFSEKMSPTSITNSTFQLYRVTSSGTTQVTNVTVTLSSDGLKATLNPFGSSTTRLAASTKFKVVVTTDAKDLAGNALDQDPMTAGDQQKTWTFTTQG